MAITTAGDIVRGALSKILVNNTQDTLSAADMTLGLDALNLLLDSWWTEKLACYAIKQESFALTPGVGSYTIGATGDWVTTRPVKIINAFARFGGVDFPVPPIDRVQYDRIPYKSTQGIPMALFYDAGYPLGTVNLYPVPQQTAGTLFFDSYLQIQSFANEVDAIDLPPGYARALIFNLALDVCDDFGVTPTASMVAIAKESKANIKRTNQQDIIAQYDYALLYNSTAYNVISDTYR